MGAPYGEDLAYVHDAGFTRFARESAPGLLAFLAEGGGRAEGPVVDLGCGTGVWARALVDAGLPAVGVDRSPAMIAIARGRVPEAEFHVGSWADWPLPACRAVTALGEVLNHPPPGAGSEESLRLLFERVHAALPPGGRFAFDVAEPGRDAARTASSFAGEGWEVRAEYAHDARARRLERRIVTVRDVGGTRRRSEVLHTLHLVPRERILAALRAAGFRARAVDAYGSFALPAGLAGFLAVRA